MHVKVKKQNSDGIVRLETSGNLKEVIIKGDLLSPGGNSVALCFKGKSSSGIVELDLAEIRMLSREVEPALNMMQASKVISSEKQSPRKKK